MEYVKRELARGSTTGSSAWKRANHWKAAGPGTSRGAGKGKGERRRAATIAGAWLESLAAEATRSTPTFARSHDSRADHHRGAPARRACPAQGRRSAGPARRLTTGTGAALRAAYHALGIPLADLVHDGNLALVDAAARFDPDRHGRFATYALWWVRQGVLHRLSVGDAGWPRSRLQPSRLGFTVTLITPRRDEEGAPLVEPGRPRRGLTPEIERLDAGEELELDDAGSILVDDGQDAVRGALVRSGRRCSSSSPRSGVPSSGSGWPCEPRSVAQICTAVASPARSSACRPRVQKLGARARSSSTDRRRHRWFSRVAWPAQSATTRAGRASSKTASNGRSLRLLADGGVDRLIDEAGFQRASQRCELATFEHDMDSQRRLDRRATAFVDAFPVVDRGCCCTAARRRQDPPRGGHAQGAIRDKGARGVFFETREPAAPGARHLQPIGRRDRDGGARPGAAGRFAGARRPGRRTHVRVGAGNARPGREHALQRQRRPTIFTSNLIDSPDSTDPRSFIFQLGARTRSRLVEMCDWVEMHGADVRETGPHASPVTDPALAEGVACLTREPAEARVCHRRQAWRARAARHQPADLRSARRARNKRWIVEREWEPGAGLP